MENCVPILYILLAPVRDEYSREALSRLKFLLYYTEHITQARIALHDHTNKLVLSMYIVKLYICSAKSYKIANKPLTAGHSFRSLSSLFFINK